MGVPFLLSPFDGFRLERCLEQYGEIKECKKVFGKDRANQVFIVSMGDVEASINVRNHCYGYQPDESAKAWNVDFMRSEGVNTKSSNDRRGGWVDQSLDDWGGKGSSWYGRKGGKNGKGKGKGKGFKGSYDWDWWQMESGWDKGGYKGGAGPMRNQRGGNRYDPYAGDWNPPKQASPSPPMPQPQRLIRSRVEVYKMEDFCCNCIATLSHRPTGGADPPTLASPLKIEQRTKLEHLRTHLDKTKQNFYTYTLAAADMSDCPGYDELIDYFKSRKRVGLLQRDDYYLYLVPPIPEFTEELRLPNAGRFH